MTSNEEWFSYMEKPEKQGVVKTGDNIPHTIEHVGEVLLSHVGQKWKLMNVLHVPTITKNLVSVRHMVDEGMHVRFTHLGYFIEEEGKVIAHGHREGRMFILNTNEVGTVLFVKGQKVELDIDLWPKQFGHVNFLRHPEMQTKNIVFRLLKFSGRNGQVCEASQLGKQHRLSFPNERNRSRNPLDVIHSDVWGPTQNVSIGGMLPYETYMRLISVISEGERCNVLICMCNVIRL